MQMAICQICKEPIWSFICPECISKGITEWLPKNLSGGFSKFNQAITNHFDTPLSSRLPCLGCKRPRPASICTFCYVKEAAEWLEGKSELAGSLMKMASSVKEEEFEPVTEFRNKEIAEGLCEYCGMFSYGLTQRNGKWICKECEEFE